MNLPADLAQVLRDAISVEQIAMGVDPLGYDTFKQADGTMLVKHRKTGKAYQIGAAQQTPLLPPSASTRAALLKN